MLVTQDPLSSFTYHPFIQNNFIHKLFLEPFVKFLVSNINNLAICIDQYLTYKLLTSRIVSTI